MLHLLSIFGDKITIDIIKKELEASGWNKELAMQRIDSSIPKIEKITFEDRQVIAFNRVRASDINFTQKYRTINVAVTQKACLK